MQILCSSQFDAHNKELKNKKFRSNFAKILSPKKANEKKIWLRNNKLIWASSKADIDRKGFNFHHQISYKMRLITQ